MPHWTNTKRALSNWCDSSAQAEYLAAHVIRFEGYTDIDPIHPHGGRDGKKDALCKNREGKKFVMAVYFPRTEKSFTDIKKKFLDDLKGVDLNSAEGIVFVTNQYLKDSHRKLLTKNTNHFVDLFHIERVVHALDSPSMEGIRKQYLDIDYLPSTVQKVENCAVDDNVLIRRDDVVLRLADCVVSIVKINVEKLLYSTKSCFTKVLLELHEVDKKEASEQNKKLLLELICELEQKVTNAFDSVIRLVFGKNLRELSDKSRLDNDKKLQEVVGFFENNLGQISSNLLDLKIAVSETRKIWDKSFFIYCKSIASSTEKRYESLIKDSLKIFINYQNK